MRYTSKLALYKPEDPDDIDVDELDSNFDRLDQTAGIIQTATGSSPPTDVLFDGAIVREANGRIWMANKTGEGVFQQLLVRSEGFQIHRYRDGGSCAPSTVSWQPSPMQTTRYSHGSGWAFPVNGGIKVPVSGWYEMSCGMEWAYDNTGWRVMSLYSMDTNGEYSAVTNGALPGANPLNMQQSLSVGWYLASGTTVSMRLKQNSGGNLNLGHGYITLNCTQEAG
jgi:hypothetical protein